MSLTSPRMIMLSSGLTAAAMILTSTSVSPGYGTGMSRMHLHPRHAAPVSPIPPAPQATLCPTSPSQSPAPGCTEGELPHQRQRFRRYGCPRSRSVCRTLYVQWGRSFLPRQSNAASCAPPPSADRRVHSPLRLGPAHDTPGFRSRRGRMNSNPTPIRNRGPCSKACFAT